MRQFLRSLIDNPWLERKFHAILTFIWLAAIPISVMTDLKTALAWVVLMSAWANFGAHFSSWQSSKAEANILNFLKKLEKRLDSIEKKLEEHD